MEKDEIICRSRSDWASPLHMVNKADGSWRPCGDYRRLNFVMVANKYPVPVMQDLSARLNGCRVFSKLYLKKGYYQIPMRPEDSHCHSFWIMGVHPDPIWPQECWANLPTPSGRSRFAHCLHLLGQHSGGQPRCGQPQSPSPRHYTEAKTIRFGTEFREV
jgi:hypothetical protein